MKVSRKCMVLEITILNKVTDTQKDDNWMFSFYVNSRI